GFIERHFGYEARFEIGLGVDNISHCDALVATHWTTAQVADRLRGRAYLPAYFVQDFEPYFSPVGSEHFAAEEPYRYGLFGVTLGQGLKGIVERFGAEARHIPFWVDRRHYFAPDARRERGHPRILYLARPDMPRRCYDLGLEALSLLAKQT